MLLRTGVVRPLTWPLRMKIAMDAAKGLAYLHEARQPVIYRDFKTSNILLDQVCTMKFQQHINVKKRKRKNFLKHQ